MLVRRVLLSYNFANLFDRRQLAFLISASHSIYYNISHHVDSGKFHSALI